MAKPAPMALAITTVKNTPGRTTSDARSLALGSGCPSPADRGFFCTARVDHESDSARRGQDRIGLVPHQVVLRRRGKPVARVTLRSGAPRRERRPPFLHANCTSSPGVTRRGPPTLASDQVRTVRQHHRHHVSSFCTTGEQTEAKPTRDGEHVAICRCVPPSVEAVRRNPRFRRSTRPHACTGEVWHFCFSLQRRIPSPLRHLVPSLDQK